MKYSLRDWQTGLRKFGQVAAVYFILGLLCWLLTGIVTVHASALWLSAGWAFACLVLFEPPRNVRAPWVPLHVWFIAVAIAASSFLLNMLINGLLSDPPTTFSRAMLCAIISSVGVFGQTLSAWFVVRWVSVANSDKSTQALSQSPPQLFVGHQSVLHFFVGALLIAAIGAVFGTLSVLARDDVIDKTDMSLGIVFWGCLLWGGDVAGLLLFAPLILGFVDPHSRRSGLRRSVRDVLVSIYPNRPDTLMLIAELVGVLAFIAGILFWISFRPRAPLLSVSLLAPLIYACFRLGDQVGRLLVLLVCFTLTVLTHFKLGPFAELPASPTHWFEHPLFFQQILILMLALTVLFTVANLTELHREKLENAREREKVENLLDQAALGLFAASADGDLLEANDMLAGWLGYKTKQDLIDKVKNTGVGQFYFEGDLTRKELIAKFEAQGRRLNNERTLLMTIDGVRLAVRIFTVGTEAHDGRKGYISTVLRESVETEFFDRASVGLGIIDVGKEQFTRVNSVLVELLGYGATGQQKLTAAKLSDLVMPDDYRLLKDFWENNQKKKIPQKGFNFVGPNREPVPTHLSAGKFEWPHGLELLCFVRRPLDSQPLLKKLTQRGGDAREYLQTCADTIKSDGDLSVHATGIWRFSSGGMVCVAAAGRWRDSCQPPTDMDFQFLEMPEAEQLRAALSAELKQTNAEEIRVALLSSRERAYGLLAISSNTSLTEDITRKEVGDPISEVAQTVTEILAEYVQAEEAKKDRDRFLEEFNHDIGNRLANFRACVGELRNTTLSEQQRDLIEQLAAVNEFLGMYVDDLLDEFESAGGTPKLQNFDPHLVVDFCKVTVPAPQTKREESWKSHGFREAPDWREEYCTCAVDPAVPRFVSGHRGVFYAVVQNFLVNAVLAAVKKVDMTVSVVADPTAPHARFLRIRCWNDGQKINEKAIRGALESTEEEGQDTRSYVGRGIGLRRIQKLCQRCGSKVIALNVTDQIVELQCDLSISHAKMPPDEKPVATDRQPAPLLGFGGDSLGGRGIEALASEAKLKPPNLLDQSMTLSPASEEGAISPLLVISWRKYSDIRDSVLNFKAQNRGVRLGVVFGSIEEASGADDPQKKINHRLLAPVAPAELAYLTTLVPPKWDPKHFERMGLVMVVEDNLTTRSLLSSQLASWGMKQLLIVSSGEEALSLVRKHHLRCDLILLDEHLGGKLMGSDVAHEVRRIEEQEPIPGAKKQKIISISASHISAHEQGRLAKDFDNFLDKKELQPTGLYFKCYDELPAGVEREWEALVGHGEDKSQSDDQLPDDVGLCETLAKNSMIVLGQITTWGYKLDKPSFHALHEWWKVWKQFAKAVDKAKQDPDPTDKLTKLFKTIIERCWTERNVC